MKKTLLLFTLAVVALVANAQSAYEEILKTTTLSASNYVAYPGPIQKKLTAAPAGYKPFYISHYGRHGSRYLIGTQDYDGSYYTLLNADRLNKLTPRGKATLEKVRMIREEAMKRDGELTQLGAEQHKGIAMRMVERFPEVFAGRAEIDAKSTVVIRCILSMENALQQMLIMNPLLNIRHDASDYDMYYMNRTNKKLNKQKWAGESRKVFDEYCKKHTDYSHLMGVLFNDAAYVADSIKVTSFGNHLFTLASNVQSTELRHNLSLYDLFTEQEIYDAWTRYNAEWYITYGPSKLNGGLQPYSQASLLKKMIIEADSCMAALKTNGASLRYGHEVCVMPLACLLDLDGYGNSEYSLDELASTNWRNYRIFPMACNIQFVFYRKSKSDTDYVFKVLLNENEARLPISTDNYPYYKWSDFKAHFLKKLAAYKEP